MCLGHLVSYVHDEFSTGVNHILLLCTEVWIASLSVHVNESESML
jgi:hypothetical protein